jgi:lactoylglutathione lyase
VFGRNASQHRLKLKNGDHVMGLSPGMFEKNVLTFNPGWNSNARKLASFTEVRELQQEAVESTTGRARFVAVDPDGNPILVDQHV